MRNNTQAIDQEFPISIKHLAPVIERIALKYPQIPKYQIALITKAFFKILRNLLFQGQTISISGFFTHLHLISFIRNNHYVLQSKCGTPRRFRDLGREI